VTERTDSESARMQRMNSARRNRREAGMEGGWEEEKTRGREGGR